MTPDSRVSSWVTREIELALNLHKRVFPLLVTGDERSAVHPRLVDVQYVDITVVFYSGMRSFGQTLRNYLTTLTDSVSDKTNKTGSKRIA